MISIKSLKIISLVIIQHITFINSSSIARSSSRTSSTKTTPSSDVDYHHNTPNKFVSASPLGIAAVCSNGIAIISFHTAPTLEQLLSSEDDGYDETQTSMISSSLPTISSLSENEPDSNAKTMATNTDLSMKYPWKDLPMLSRGPHRIEPIDSYGSVLLGAGWRTDSATLASKCREFAEFELDQYGALPKLYRHDDGNNGKQNSKVDFGAAFLSYGRYLANSLAIWMAKCFFSDSVRSLSCVGLIATVSGQCRDGTPNSHGGYLWLVDATGAYRIRAHAIGIGAERINKQLMAADFSKLTVEEGVQFLLDIVKQECASKTDVEKNTNSSQESIIRSDWNLPPWSIVEMAVVDSSRQKLRRIRLPFFGKM